MPGLASVELQPPPLDLAKPETFAARARLAQAIEGHYGRTVSPLSSSEAEQLKRALDQAPAEQRVALVGALADNFTPEQTAALANQLARQGAGDLSQP
jgi:DNA-directed RNA polymerase specialized sigma24 family protein